MKRLLDRRFGVLFAVLMVAVAACGDGGAETTTTAPAATTTAPAATTTEEPTTTAAAEAEPVQIAFFAPLANSYVAATIEGMEEVAAREGAEITRFDTGFDATLEFNQMQDAIAQGTFDAFIVIPLDPVALVPAAEEAIAAGIAVVNTDLALGPDLTTSQPQIEGQAGTVMTPGTVRADSITDLLLAACENVDPCRVGWIAGVATIDFEVKIKERLDQIVADNPNIQLVAYQDGGGYLADPAVAIAQDILLANPELEVLATSGDQMTSGAEIAVTDAGLTPGEDILLIGGGGSCPGVSAVTDGRWFGTTLDVPRNEGVLGAEIAIGWVRGEITEPQGLDAQAESGFPLLLTADTVSQFECQWEG
ncbi:MAG TPA: sugar ABC transporter substrate-binding protein [Acidimicrobiia bacterium]|nr:sugar ABC transporter substrate-binding protein [Acidimicrobiia bacterium]